MPSLDPPNGLIPETPEQLTPSWLATVFTRYGFSAAIESIDFRPIEANPLTSQILRVVPRVQDETTGFAPPLVWKRSLADPEARRPFHRGYATEVAFYRDLAPHLGVRVPRCFAAAYDDDSGAHVLLLEEVKGTRGDYIEGVTPDQAATVLHELARLHVTDWDDSNQRQPAPEFDRLEALVERWEPAAVPFLTRHVDNQAAERTRRYAGAVASLFSDLSAAPQTVTHGDAHQANAVFPDAPDARPVLLDWQGSHIDAPIRDVARFLVLGLTTEDRRAHEEALLDGYLAQLRKLGVPYQASRARNDYRTALLLQWGWAVIFFRLEPNWDPTTRAAMPVLARRAAAAFDDAWEMSRES